MSATAVTLDVSSLSLDDLLAREWLATNGLGGFAASTVAGANTRKYHGLLVAAMSPPVRGMVLLSRVEETVFTDGWPHALATNEYPETVNPQGYKLMRAFAADPFPRWAFQGDGWALEKQLQMLDGENTVVLSYTLLGAAKGVEMEVRPLFALRGIHELMYQWNGNLIPREVGSIAQPQAADASQHLHIPATHRTPEAFFAHDGRWRAEAYWYLNTIYRRESERGYSGLEDVWAPGVARYRLVPGQTVHFVCSTDPIDVERAVARAREQEARSAAAVVACALPRGADREAAGLRRAAEQFVVRTREGRPALASGYPWAPPNGRDTMIALPGVLLATGRYEQARAVLEDFAGLAKNGLMPGEFPTDGTAPRYTAADTSLWWVNALHAYLTYTGDDQTGRALFEVVDQALTAMFRGTGLGVRADHEGLLTAGSPTTAVTWMNAQVNESPITPRHGRPVDVNALWYNALRVGADLAKRYHFPVRAEELFTLANRARHAFNAAFWNPQASCLFDVVGDGGNDAAVRPNQLLAISLPYPVLNPDRQQQVFDRVRDELLSPYGVRTLSPRDANYHGRYGGTVLARDGAYHQGPAFPWLLGPFVTAFTRLHGRSASARREAGDMLRPCLEHMCGAGLGQLPELFDGEPPYHAGGLPASARSVGEVLRAYVEDVAGPVGENEVKVSLAARANGVV
ncbi:MAG TPA: amylo-alpha-1,6-glucosidase [Tepidisphaeraceae bacterium]|nr:amylo-alpha-1,6-glucosidase [Tepidisphaeraceae bacterium]